MTQPQPTPAEPFPQPIELPGPPTVADDPTGLTYDRADLGEPAATRKAGDGFAITGRGEYAMQLKPCCGIGAGEVCDCAEFAAELRRAPVIVMARKPFDLKALAAAHTTAAEQDRREREAAA